MRETAVGFVGNGQLTTECLQFLPQHLIVVLPVRDISAHSVW
jgi:hypothetical protein